MDLIKDQAVDSVHHSISFSSYHIPFLWGRNYNVSFTDFLFADAHVTSKLSYLQF